MGLQFTADQWAHVAALGGFPVLLSFACTGSEHVALRLHPNALDDSEEGSSALHSACMHKQLSVMHLLLERRIVDINATQGGATPLHVASSVGNMEAVQVLLEHRALIDKTCTEIKKKTPL